MSDYQKLKEEHDELKEQYRAMVRLLVKLANNLDDVASLNRVSLDLIKSLLKLDIDFSEKK